MKTLLRISPIAAFLVLATIAAPPVQAQDAWSGTPQETFLNSEIIARYACTTCHTIGNAGGMVGPILNRIGSRRSEDWLRRWLADPQQVKPGTKMPTFAFTEQEYESAVGYLSAMKTEVDSDAILARTDLDEVGKGEALFQALDCNACHRLGDVGLFVGPDLTWVGLRKERAWERVWLHDPAAWKASTFMPNFGLADAEIEVLTAFLEAQRGQQNESGQMWEFQAAFFLGGDPEQRGEHVYNRFGCWACHGRPGDGGERNPNAAPNGVVPSIDDATLSYTAEQLHTRLSEQVRPAKLDPDGEQPPFFCPPYAKHMSENEFNNLFAYLESLVPEGAKWEFR